jgi:hypothetical protein
MKDESINIKCIQSEQGYGSNKINNKIFPLDIRKEMIT